MKKVITKLNMAIISAMVAMPAMAAPAQAVDNNGLCKLLERLHGVFITLRTLAFVGAAFIIAGWAWGYISKGEVKMDDLKAKGTGMLVGFILLFAIGIVLTFLLSNDGMNTVGCKHVLETW